MDKTENRKKLKAGHIIAFSAMAFLLIVVIAVNIAAVIMSQWLTDFFGGRGTGEVSEVTLEGADALVQEIEAEGIVMLKNEKNALPLRHPEINVFGWASTDAGFIASGSGSGDAVERGGGAVEKTGFLNGLRKAGFMPNETLSGNGRTGSEKKAGLYEQFKSQKDGSNKSLDDPAEVFFRLYEPSREFYTAAIMQEALSYSDTALIVISRSGGEGQDLPFVQYRAQVAGGRTKSTITDTSRTYLQLSPEEEDLIDLVTNAGFAKVIMVINTMNAIQMDFADNSKINSIISVGGPGQSGCISIGRMLRGQINPSGKTTDTYTYDLTTDPTFENAGDKGVMQYQGKSANEYTPNGSAPGTSYIDYAESIYVGYKWYETADAEGYWDRKGRGGYDNVVKYPFGYGLSYSTFTWEVRDVAPSNGSVLDKDGEISITVRVTNDKSSPTSGKDVVELYYTPEYKPNGIEKAAVNLCAYAKTELLAPGEYEDVTLKFKVSDMKSYDCYDKNLNGYATYELDAGSYEISLRTDAHHKADCRNNTVSYRVAQDIIYDTDTNSGEAVVNRFTGPDAYANVPIDGSDEGTAVTYLSRYDFEATFPSSGYRDAHSRRINNRVEQMGVSWYEPNQVAVMPETGSSKTNYMLSLQSGERTEFNDELVTALGSNYDDERWTDIISQISRQELVELVEDGGFQTAALASVGKPKNIDLDGPTGLNGNAIGGQENLAEKTAWTIYPVEIVLAASWNDELAFRFGQSVGLEAQESSVSGWYAPGANIHRSPFDGRNFEYYSEDAFLSGRMCASEVYGCLTKGLYPYMKHFAVNETEKLRSGLYTWLTEQSLREIYLRPFEIAVKEGQANAIMTSYNCIGAVWSGGNKALLEDLVRGEWGFRGTMLTDWSSGGNYMNVDQGLAAGSDAWLNGAHWRDGMGHDQKNTAAGVADMQRAAKNILYTYCNTYYIAKTGGDGMTFKQPNAVFPVWIFIVIAVDVVAAAAITTGTIFTVRSIKGVKKQKKTDQNE